MSDTIRNQYNPNLVSPPGETLEEVLESRGMSQAELAERTGRPKKTINEIIRGKAAITAETALQFEKVLDIPAAFWIAREQNYREAIARGKQLDLFEKESDWLEQIPYRAMVKLGWVTEYHHKSRQLEEVLRFFAVATPVSWKGLWSSSNPAYRRSLTFRSKPGSVAAWLRKGEIEAAKQNCSEFSSNMFKDALRDIRSLTRALPRNFPSIVTNACRAAGVSVVFVPELPGTNMWGATRWLTPTKALIQLSLRYKTDDHLWFTFFHEAAHILLHGRREVFLEEDEQEKNNKEAEADAFSREWLIPGSRFRIFKRHGSYSDAAIHRFARELGIAPGIVVGRLQHDGLLDRFQYNELKKPVDWVFAM